MKATASAAPMKCSTWSRWRAEPAFLLYSDVYAGFRYSTGRRNGHTDGARGTPPRMLPSSFLLCRVCRFWSTACERSPLCRAISCIYVAVRKPEMGRMEAMIAEYALASRVRVVEGGDTRQESVSQALKALSAADDDIILVHDAVRPLIDPATIERTIEAVESYGAAIVGLPAVDTIKQVERTARGAIVTATIPREYIVQAQTPTGFPLARSASSLCRRGSRWVYWNR